MINGIFHKFDTIRSKLPIVYIEGLHTKSLNANKIVYATIEDSNQSEHQPSHNRYELVHCVHNR